MVKKIFFTIIVLLLSCLLGLFISEIFLQFIKFKPFLSKINVQWTEEDKFIKWAYLDIHEPFFMIQDGEFYIQRQDLWRPRNNILKYKLQNDKNKKRVFILGESVARDFKDNILYEELSKYLDVEIINVGMGSYDSYRIEKISKELKFLKPDWVVICIGNNDGINNLFNFTKIEPVDINYLPYKYAVFKKLKILNILSNYICKEIRLNKNNVETNFQNNILKIVNNLKNSNIIFCDLPNNEYFLFGDFFKTLQLRISRDLYYKSLWKNTVDYKALNSRINFIKNLSDEKGNIYITDLTKKIKEYNNDKLDYKVFYDCYHFTDPTYELLSQLITKIIVKQELKEDIENIFNKGDYKNLLIKYMLDIPKSFISTEYYYSFVQILNQKYKFDYEQFYLEYNKIYCDFKNNINKTYENYMAIILYADVLQENKRIKEGKEILNTLIKIIPKRYEAYLLLGFIYYKENDFKQAEKYFNDVNQLNPELKVSCAFFNSLK